MSADVDSAIAQANRQTPDDLERACERAAIRSGMLLVETILLHDGDPAKYRQMMIDSFDITAIQRA